MGESIMQGKVYLVTGSSSGIGKVTARELARMGATVVLVCRNRAKGEAAQAEIKQVSGNPQVDLIVADLSELSQVRHAASEFQKRYPRLHVLIHNAGAIHGERKGTSDGPEATFVTNYLAPFLLTRLLLDVLKASAPARIVNVSSSGHTRGHLDFADLQGEHRYMFLKAYTQSKLAQLYFTYELAEQLTDTGVTVNALHPGLVTSNFNSGTRGIAHLIGAVVYFLTGISVEKGAQTTLYLATSPEVEEVSGKYFIKCEQASSSRLSYDVSEKTRPPQHFINAVTLTNLSRCYWFQGKFSEAEQRMQQALPLLEQFAEPASQEFATGLKQLATIYRDQGKRSQATLLYQRSLDIYRKIVPLPRLSIAYCLEASATNYAMQDDVLHAEFMYREALSLFEAVWGTEHPDVASCLCRLADVCMALNNFDQVERYNRRALAIYEQFGGPEYLELNQPLLGLAILYHHAYKKDVEAEALYKQAIKIIENNQGPDHPDLVAALQSYAHLLLSKKEFREAQKLIRRAQTIENKILGH